jgi:hypothetical protein
VLCNVSPATSSNFVQSSVHDSNPGYRFLNGVYKKIQVTSLSLEELRYLLDASANTASTVRL